ncbi:hypothetical protein BGZ63DRAFT_421534 [Mariannaea sp. PMI_226]|nr:hypothetical protein BGZ63DRAFT_421534 [Mariannaea sp. PMI_226]
MTQTYHIRESSHSDDGHSPGEGVVRGNVRLLQSLFQKRNQITEPFKVGVSFLAKETLRENHVNDTFVVSLDGEPMPISMVPLSHSEGFHNKFEAYIMVYHRGSEEVIHKLINLGKLVVVICMEEGLPLSKPIPELIAQRENCHVTMGTNSDFDHGMLRLTRRLRDRRRWGSKSHAVCY